MTDPNKLCAHELAREVLQHPCMGQALDWLIALQCPAPGQQAKFQAWLDSDPAHPDAFARAQAAWGGAPVQQAAEALDTPLKSARGRRFKSHAKPLAVAAVLLLGLFSFSNLPMRLQADHMTLVGERQRLQLDDGSKVLLNTHSAFSSTINEHQRIGHLYQGEAFFEVAPNRGLPLEIDAGPVRAVVRDTAFAVRYLNGKEAQVQVQRGDVDLSNTFDDARVRLSAGESIRIGPNGFGLPARLDAHKELAWVQGRLIFENRPMSEVLDELQRYYPGWIVNHNQKLASTPVTGNYRLDQPLDVVRSLAQITSAKLSQFPALVILN